MVEVKSTIKAPFEIDRELEGEIGVCIVDGYIEACGEKVEKGNMLVSKKEDICRLVIGENTHLLIFGGKPFKEERFIYWNFVASDKEQLEQAKEQWVNKKFDMVPGEKGYVPLPRP